MQEISHILSPGSLLSVTVYYGAALQPQLMKVCVPQCGLRCQSASRQRRRAPPVRCPRPGCGSPRCSCSCRCCCCSARPARCPHRPAVSHSHSHSHTHGPRGARAPRSALAGRGAAMGFQSAAPLPCCGRGAGGPGRAHAGLPLLCGASGGFPGKAPLCGLRTPPNPPGPFSAPPNSPGLVPGTPKSAGSFSANPSPGTPNPPVPSVQPRPRGVPSPGTPIPPGPELIPGSHFCVYSGVPCRVPGKRDGGFGDSPPTHPLQTTPPELNSGV